ncbi:MAG: hypothetical protein ACFB9M_07225 [Myxococcota bacterium]
MKERRSSFDRTKLAGSVIVDAIPEGARPVGAVFGNALELAAVRVEPEMPRPGDVVTIEYYWRVLRPTARDFKVFVHGDALEGSYRRLHGDHWPADGKYPTGVWQEGEIIRDSFRFAIPGSYGPPRLGLYTGLYRGEDRLDLTDKGERPATRDDRSLAAEFRL